MKTTTAIILLMLLFTACSDTKKEEKALQKQVVDFHEKVMADDEKAMISKMKLDTVIQQPGSVNKQEAIAISKKLVAADEAMSQWMNNLKLEYNGMGHDEIMQYLHQQQVKVKQVDSMLVSATSQSDQYLKKSRNE